MIVKLLVILEFRRSAAVDDGSGTESSGIISASSITDPAETLPMWKLEDGRSDAAAKSSTTLRLNLSGSSDTSPPVALKSRPSLDVSCAGLRIC